jgi:hypothetical protein
MPGRSGVTAPIVPDNRTTGTSAAPLRHRCGTSFAKLCITFAIQITLLPDAHFTEHSPIQITTVSSERVERELLSSDILQTTCSGE